MASVEVGGSKESDTVDATHGKAHLENDANSSEEVLGGKDILCAHISPGRWIWY